MTSTPKSYLLVLLVPPQDTHTHTQSERPARPNNQPLMEASCQCHPYVRRQVTEWQDFTCAFVDCAAACVSSREAAEWPVLGVLLSLWGRPPTPSWQPCADASMKPLHSLTLLSPSSHSLARQNPAIVPSHGVANSQTHTRVHMHSASRWIPNYIYLYI